MKSTTRLSLTLSYTEWKRLVPIGPAMTYRSGSNNLRTAVIRKTTYDTQVFSKHIHENEPSLISDQLQAYRTILKSVCQRQGRITFLFLDVPGRTGNTFITKLLVEEFRRHQYIAVAVAIFRIAATLLPSAGEYT